MTWVEVDGEIDDKDVAIYSLSYCHACDKAKNYLREKDIEFRYLDIDKASPEDRSEAAGLFGMGIPEGGISIAFPIIVMNDEKIIGFDPEKISEKLDLQKEEKE
jgi:glutaredoxin